MNTAFKQESLLCPARNRLLGLALGCALAGAAHGQTGDRITIFLAEERSVVQSGKQERERFILRRFFGV